MQTQDRPTSQMTKPTSRPHRQTRNDMSRQVRPRISFAAAIIALALVAAACGSGESSETASVVVPGTEQWTDTGIDLSTDDTVLIEADGAVTPARNPAIPLNDPGDPRLATSHRSREMTTSAESTPRSLGSGARALSPAIRGTRSYSRRGEPRTRPGCTETRCRWSTWTTPSWTAI